MLAALNCALRSVSTAGGSWAALLVLLKHGACRHQEGGCCASFKQKEECHLSSLSKARAACSDCLLYTETVQSFLCRNVIPDGSPKMPQSYLKGGDRPTMLGAIPEFQEKGLFWAPKKSLPEFLIVFSLSWCTTPLPLNQSGFNCIQCLAQGARSTALGAEGSSLAVR